MIRLHDMIERAARLNPTGIATHYQTRSHSWSETLERISRLAAGFASFKPDDGDRVAILSLNNDRYYEAMFATFWASLCVVPMNTRWALPENTYALTDSGSRILLFDDAFTEQAKQLNEATEQLIALIYIGEGNCPEWATDYEQLIASNQPLAPSSRGGEAMAGIFYTGGTTGFPKGVMQSHSAIWSSALGASEQIGMRREQSYLHTAPMFHMADLCGSMGATLGAATHVVLQGFEPGEVLKTISEQQITHTLLVPAMIKMTLNHPDASTADVSSLQTIIYGASPMPAETLKQCMQTWPEVGLVQAYGQTEMAPIVSLLSAADHRTGGEILKSAGRPSSVTDVRIVDEEGNDCPINQSGEIVARGPHCMLGYWNKPEETAKALQDGWVFTGDAGMLNEDGYLFIVDRVKDMVITGGENVFTTEVENAIIGHEAVQDVAVIGIPHEEWGEAVHAIVILHPGKDVSEADLIAHCRQQIAGYKLPKSITFREEPLPLSGAGKVLKTELRKPYWGDKARQVN
ncbi:MAG: long-chain fatty acid--CoA ligase [Candidatus Pelagadaptatus aseana]|uniref:acyl-CoA synthetase n=1 Tax=Candidatus Pelagadaptatus aseana TaxID=3120508 RepID=UPI0039B35D2F